MTVGGVKIATAHDLKAGKVRSCGCMKKERSGNRLDLAGQQFGRLTCLYPDSRRSNKGSVYWHCFCACGKETEVPASGLVQGNVKSCGCLKQEVRQEIPSRLRHVEGTCIEILEKRKHRKDNKSGFRGVYRLPNGRYRVDIGFRGRRFYVGTFPSYEDAVQARREAEEKLYIPFLKAYRQWEEEAARDPDWAEENPFHAEEVTL